MARIFISDGAAFDREVLRSGLPVVAEFTVEWVGLGDIWNKIVGDLSREFVGRVKFVIVDVDEFPAIPANYAIKGVPAFLAFDGGEFKGHTVSELAKADLRSWIQRTLDIQSSGGVVMSVCSQYADAIAAGTKRGEFRRKRMHELVSHAIFTPRCPKSGLFASVRRFCGVDWDKPDDLWAHWRR